MGVLFLDNFVQLNKLYHLNDKYKVQTRPKHSKTDSIENYLIHWLDYLPR